MRGMGSDYTLILVDGKRQNNHGDIYPNNFGGNQFNHIPPIETIERIEVIRGPMSTLYGADALGGVINIITRKVGKTWAGVVSLSGTWQENRDRGDNASANVYLSGPIQQDLLGLTLRASTFKRAASALEPTGNAGNTTISTRGPSPVKADIDTIGARLTLTPTRDHELYLDLDTARQVYDNSAAQLGTLGVQGYTDQQKFNREQTVLAYNANLGIGRLETSLTHNETETIGRTIPNGTPGKVPGSARTLTAENRILDAKLITAVGESHLLTVGAQHWEAEMVDGVAPAPYTYTQWAVFGEDEWRLRPDLALTLGARYDDHSQFGAQFSPRIYTVWDAHPNWTVKGGVSRGFKTPRLDQLADGITGFTGQGTRPTIGTPSLKPETSTSYEFGTLFDDKQGFTLGATVFFNQFKDKIATGSGLLNCSFAAQPNRPGCVDYGNWPAVDTYGQSVNVDEAETRGTFLEILQQSLHVGDVLARKLVALGEVRDQRRQPAVEQAIEQIAALAADPGLAGQHGRVAEAPAVLRGPHGALLHQSSQQGLDGGHLPVLVAGQLGDHLLGTAGAAAPEHFHHDAFGFTDLHGFVYGFNPDIRLQM